MEWRMNDRHRRVSGWKWNFFDMTWPFDTDDSIIQYLNQLIVFIVILICRNYWKCSFWCIEIGRSQCALSSFSCIAARMHWNDYRAIVLIWLQSKMPVVRWMLVHRIDPISTESYRKHVTFDRTSKQNKRRRGDSWKEQTKMMLESTLLQRRPSIEANKAKRHISEFPVYWNQTLSSRTAKFDFSKFDFIIQYRSHTFGSPYIYRSGVQIPETEIVYAREHERSHNNEFLAKYV